MKVKNLKYNNKARKNENIKVKCVTENVNDKIEYE